MAGNCGHKFVVDGIDRSLSVYPGVAPVRHMYVVRSTGTRIFIFIFFYYHGITVPGYRSCVYPL